MKKKIELTEPVEVTAGVTFRAEPSGLHFIVSRNQGSGFKPCGKDGLWSETPHLYRNEYLAAQALTYFVENS
jgi:hypothetical protein